MDLHIKTLICLLISHHLKNICVFAVLPESRSCPRFFNGVLFLLAGSLWSSPASPKNISLSDGHSIFADLLSVDYIVAKIFIVSRISKRMEIIADEEKYTFAEVIRDFCQDYYSEHKPTLAERLDEMYSLNDKVKIG